MILSTLAENLRCPFCFSAGTGSRPLSPAGALTLGCDAGHRFDVNKRGYISLLPPRTRVVGDSVAMLTARSRFFDTGWYAPIASAVAAAGAAALEAVPGRRRVAEVGCGTGYYLDALVSVLPNALPLAADLSPDAVRMAVSAVQDAVGVVLDVWQPLPLADASQDLLLSVFAPRNLPEFARVLADDGCLIAVVPTGDHLREARDAGLALDVPGGKADDLVRSASALFVETARAEVTFRMELDRETLALLIGMGPSAHHSRDGGGSGADVPASVTASVTVVTLRRRG
ncbi:23S rRNA (guanine745-N1)-methyltransferase [Mycetocola sp. CAN_C7]|uniref:methyltransferase domain-containing protein n=1 Tax=Mycetocola sp. CAN_C7 TaxID=2787724 RepID=UPI0018CA2D79